MRVAVLAVGRLKAGPERELCARYGERFQRAGRALGLDLQQREFEESQARRPEDRQEEEAVALAAAIPAGGVSVLWDERGRACSSRDFAARLAGWRDSGTRDLAMVLGGPDGLAPRLRQEASLVLSFGALTLPHQLARALVLEQLYRASAILAGHPYHRD